MLKNYLKIGLRNLLLHRYYSIINITGLAAGICCCLFIVLYIHDELSFDRYHENADRIHRVTMEDWARLSPAVAPAMAASYPHLVEEAVRLWPLFAPAKLRSGENVFVESNGVFADPGIFSVFSWPMIAGNPAKALTSQRSIVVTRSTAKKYFGMNDPVGRHMEFWGFDMTVTGVMEDVPLNSHLRFDFLISFSTLYDIMGRDLNENWRLPAFFTYVLTRHGVPSADIEGAARELFASHKVDGPASPVVQPLTRIHMHSDLEGEFAPGGNVAYLLTLGTAAIIVLLLACINFTNLTTARAATRIKEVGMRKVMGAMRRQLIAQFFGEALMMTLAAFIMAILLAQLFMPAFNQLAGKAVDVRSMADPVLACGLFMLMLLIGLVAGGYPALYLSKFLPVTVLKGSGNLRVSNLMLRKGLIVFQFMISTVFMVGTAVVMLQLDYLQTKDLGFDQEQVLILDGDNFPQVRDALQGIAGVEQVAGVPQLFGARLPSSPFRTEGAFEDSLTQIFHYGVTRDFIETMGMQLVAGRSFAQGSVSDEADAYVLNESAVRKLGWDPEAAIGKRFSMYVPPVGGGKESWRDGRVIGVLKDFNFSALYERIEPVALYPSFDLNFTFVRLSQVNPQVMSAINAVWSSVNPDAPFNYYFLDDHLRQKYEAEEKLGNIMGAATTLAIIIACLGLFGMVAFTAGQRTKEIGIRKVFGASVGEIVTLLANDFLKLVAVAVILSIPLAHFAMGAWLRNFAYHIELSWLIFAAVGLFALALAVATVSYQAISAASADPAESIRYE